MKIRLKKCKNSSVGEAMAANTKGKGKKKRRSQKTQTNAVQKLYDACKVVFASSCTGFIPSVHHLEMLQAMLDDIKPTDVGLHPDMPYFRKGNPAPITYVPIDENEHFSIAIFCLPPSSVIPLHNHPGMTVFSKLLFGTMHVKSFDWAEDEAATRVEEENEAKARMAKVKMDRDVTAPCEATILYPAEGGNMHCFTAVTACAILDVLGPPYSSEDGRHCTYFRNFKSGIGGEEREGYEWLEEIKNPEELRMVGERYSASKIVK